MSQSSSKSSPATKAAGDVCKVCLKGVGKKDKSIYCDFCKMWLHQTCSKLDDSSFDVLSKSDQMYFCFTCLPLAKHVIGIEKRIDEAEARLKTLEERVQKLESAPTIRPQPLMSIPCAAPTVTTSTFSDRDEMRDELERESKRKNAVLFGLEQVSSRNDTDVVKQLISDADVEGLSPDDIVTVFRDGPLYEDKPRFCKVYCTSIDAKARFIEFINNCRKSETDGFVNLRARPDLSFLQRKRARELRAELKARTDNGETNLYVDYKSECIKQGRVRRII
jgi:PHD-finger